MPPRIVYARTSRTQDLTGKTFGRWTVVRFDHRKIWKTASHAFWECVCSCPNATVRIVSGPSLVGGGSLSCGCYCRERIIESNTTHGHTTHNKKHPLVTTHGNMMDRCYNPNCVNYRHYGAKGIIVEKEWHDVGNFIRDMAPSWNYGYTVDWEKVSLDRISPTGNYGPGLCKWSTAIEQANNQSKNVWIEANGKRQTLAQWARELNCSPTSLARRKELGWTDEECVNIPIGGRRSDVRKGVRI